MSIKNDGAYALVCSCGGRCDVPPEAYGAEVMRLWASFREVHATCPDESDMATEERAWAFHKAADVARTQRRRGAAV